MKKNDQQKIDDKKTSDFWGNVGGIIIILLILGAIGSAFEFISDKWKKRSSRKSYCADRIEHVKNEFTAKKIYKACMDR